MRGVRQNLLSLFPREGRKGWNRKREEGGVKEGTEREREVRKDRVRNKEEKRRGKRRKRIGRRKKE